MTVITSPKKALARVSDHTKKMLFSPDEADDQLSVKPRPKSVFAAVLDGIASVRFGIFLLIALVVLSVAGMVIPQQGVDGFAEFFASLSPRTRTALTFAGAFDIYRSWYYNALLSLLAVNIVLSSADRFPGTLRFVRRPLTAPTAEWIRRRKFVAEADHAGPPEAALKHVREALAGAGFRRVLAQDGSLFAEKGAWNRFGAYPVHAALLLILGGGFVTAQFSFSGQMSLAAGQTAQSIRETVVREAAPVVSTRTLPFSVTATDLRQVLINDRGPLESSNTIDWITTLEFRSGERTRVAEVSLNRPFDFEGYRFFHSGFQPIGKARNIDLRIESGSAVTEVRLGRGEAARLADGRALRFIDFRSNLSLSGRVENENAVDFPNPAAVLELAEADGSRKRTVFAFRDNRTGNLDGLSRTDGLNIRLVGFEKVADQHVLFVRRDPGTPFVYAGFALLAVSLAAVFGFSHRRIWIALVPHGETLLVTIGGDTNRDPEGFGRRFRSLAAAVAARDPRA